MLFKQLMAKLIDISQTGSKNSAPVKISRIKSINFASSCFDDFRQNTSAFSAEFKNQMRKIVLFQLP